MATAGISIAVTIASAVVQGGLKFLAAKNEAKARAQEAALLQQQADERAQQLRLQALDQENELIRQRNITLSSIRARRATQLQDDFGTFSVKAGIDEEIRLTETDIANTRIGVLGQIRQDQFQVARSNLVAQSAASNVRSQFAKSLFTVGAATARSGVFKNALSTTSSSTFPSSGPP